MFWQNFLELCAELGKYPNEVASEIGLKSTGTVSGWKRGSIPRPIVLKRIAKYFSVKLGREVTVSDLMKEDIPINAKDIQLDDFTYAMHHHSEELTDSDKELLLSMARQLAEAHRKKNDGETTQ